MLNNITFAIEINLQNKLITIFFQKQKSNMMKLPKVLSGIAGEYYVAAELSRRGFLAAITLRNSDGIDILISSLNGDQLFSVQVKTTQNKFKWFLNMKIENETAENKYFVFVSMPANLSDHPKYRIIKATELAQHIKISHAHWLTVEGKNGKKHNDSPARQFDDRYRHNMNVFENWDEFINNIKTL
jgi:hypothetical protein